ncbi:hypothetical protein CROQUDRAFT_86864 [Cronartium quercuum f. sp. fusiforme G11]|uniref:Uncharacterized protein n=1 Tax=Cronartium quercuum f. sp. fusiforme G11 TaxID=708437 RepID=A0A9P6NSJ4_9BASI|nr:hypothetical protein CROQUDRAFT_86864 [Cronartium quercuum f. sp. fusiforme G11]
MVSDFYVIPDVCAAANQRQQSAIDNIFISSHSISIDSNPIIDQRLTISAIYRSKYQHSLYPSSTLSRLTVKVVSLLHTEALTCMSWRSTNFARPVWKPKTIPSTVLVQANTFVAAGVLLNEHGPNAPACTGFLIAQQTGTVGINVGSIRLDFKAQIKPSREFGHHFNFGLTKHTERCPTQFSDPATNLTIVTFPDYSFHQTQCAPFINVVGRALLAKQ